MRDEKCKILLPQAELAPTKIIFIDPCHVGATFGCDAAPCQYPDLFDRDLEVAPTVIILRLTRFALCAMLSVSDRARAKGPCPLALLSR